MGDSGISFERKAICLSTNRTWGLMWRQLKLAVNRTVEYCLRFTSVNWTCSRDYTMLVCKVLKNQQRELRWSDVPNATGPLIITFLYSRVVTTPFQQIVPQHAIYLTNEDQQTAAGDNLLVYHQLSFSLDWKIYPSSQVEWVRNLPNKRDERNSLTLLVTIK